MPIEFPIMGNKGNTFSSFSAKKFGFGTLRHLWRRWHKFLINLCVIEMPMNIMDIKNRWNEVRYHLKQRYGWLTDEDLTLSLGREGDLLERLQKKLGMSKADVLRILGEV